MLRSTPKNRDLGLYGHSSSLRELSLKTSHCTGLLGELWLIRTVRSDNGATVKTSLKNRLRILSNYFAISPKSPCYLKEGNLGWSWREGATPDWVQTEMVEFITLPFPFSSKPKIWPFHVVVVQGPQRNVQKSVMHVQGCCFPHWTFSLSSPS